VSTTPDTNEGTKNTKRKKMVRQQDKPRVRKRNVGNKHQETTEQNERDVQCLMCGERYSNSCTGESWIQCMACKNWCHEDCTDGETSEGFKCDFCH